MKKMMSYAVVTLIAGLFLVNPALSGKIDKMQAAQHKRIQQGIRKGHLTKAEVKVLQKEQRKIRRLKRHFLIDGELSRGERHKLGVLQKHADTHIRRLRHNQVVRPRQRPGGPKPGVRCRRIAAGQSFGHPV